MTGEKVVTEESSGDFIDSWIRIGVPARERTRRYLSEASFEEQCAYCEKESINVSLSNLMSFPWIRELVNRRELALHGFLYDIKGGSMSTWSLDYQLTDYERIG